MSDKNDCIKVCAIVGGIAGVLALAYWQLIKNIYSVKIDCVTDENYEENNK